MDAIDRLRQRLGGAAVGPPSGSEDADPEEEGMVRMSFLQHLEELRSRLIKCLWGLAVAFGLSLGFCDRLWAFVCQPAAAALKSLHYEPTLWATEIGRASCRERG